MSPSRVEQTLAPAGRTGPRWTRAALALVLTAALVGVAGIGSGRSLVRIGGPRRMLDVASFASDALVVAGVLLLAVLVYQLKQRRWATSEHTSAGVRSQLLLLVWMIAAFFLARYLKPDGTTSPGRRTPLQPPPAKKPAGRLPPVHWWPLAAIGIVLLLTGIVAWHAGRTTRAPFVEETANGGDELREAIEISLAEIEREPDPRRAVIRAYARMEQVLARQGLARQSSETALEHLRRALTALQISTGAAQRLAALFERAKFSAHQVDARMKHDALVALTDVQAELGDP
jgi:hypothetical protein